MAEARHGVDCSIGFRADEQTRLSPSSPRDYISDSVASLVDSGVRGGIRIRMEALEHVGFD